MNLLLRILIVIMNILAKIADVLLNLLLTRRPPDYPAIKNKLLLKSVSELLVELHQNKLTSTEIVRAYVNRIREVNPQLNAVVTERFTEALNEAAHADSLITKAAQVQQIPALFERYPLLGIPFTVKESCAVKGLSFMVGSLHRLNKTSENNGEVVELLRAAGCIPLLVSANPEFCLSFETNTHVHGRCLNPYNLLRSSAGSSGGEGTLNGCGASLFGLGSDIGGSIRLPAFFCGVFGHKPTGGLTSVKGHFPNSAIDPKFAHHLQLGPITRFARDLPILMQFMAGDNAKKLQLEHNLPLKALKIYYALGFDNLNGWLHPTVSHEIKAEIMRAVKYFHKSGLETQKLDLAMLNNSLEITVAGLVSLKGVPSIMTQSAHILPRKRALIIEFIKALCGHKIFTKEALFMEAMFNMKSFMSQKSLDALCEETENLKKELSNVLGENGILLMPTFHSPALFFNTSILNIGGIDMTALFNILGFPATHIPMGLNNAGLPIGFQVIAAPYQDKLCFQIAMELERSFGGWIPAIMHDFSV